MTYDIISKRFSRKEISIKRPDDLFQFLKKYSKSRQEQFFVITLDGSHKVIGIHISTIGLSNKTIVHPREVFIHLIKDNSTSFVVSHNHPSGKLTPSFEDEEITKILIKSSKILSFNFLDHIIFSKKGYLSFREQNYLFDDI